MHDDSSPAEGGDVSGNANALAKGTRLFEFEIERVLGEGGFAIVYLAFDHSLHRRVALKEYLPAEFAFRQDENTIVLRSVQHRKTFEAGRQSFVQEARFLAQFEHPSLVKVHRVFESNGTAYMVQGYYPGESLSAALKAGRRYASDDELRPLVTALVAAVDLLHARQCLHRDIAPDNIIIQPNGVPVLLDFGAARRIIGDMTQALTAVLKPSYAPIEQYAEDGGLAQGPWTDVYALAATLRTAITGKPPPSAIGRTIKDGLVRLADDPPPNFDLVLLRGIDAGLALLPADRPQTMAAFRAAMGLPAEEEATTPPAAEVPRAEGPPEADPTPVTVPITHAAGPPPPIRVGPPATPPAQPARVPPRAASPRKRIKRGDLMLAVIAAAALGLLLMVPFAADWMWPSPAPTPRPQVGQAPGPAPATPPSPVPVPPVVAEAPPPLPPASAPVPPTPPPAPMPESAPTRSMPLAPPAKDAQPAAAPDKPPPPPAKAASFPEPAPPPKPEPAAKPVPRDPAPATAPPPSASLTPAPSQPVPHAAPTPPPPREEPPPAKPAVAAPPQQAASLAPPEVAKARRTLVRLSGEPPVYPRDAIRAGIETGRVVALVTVDAQGNVAGIDIVRSEPPRVFDRAARAALGAWKFKPEGERYQGEVEVLFNFRQ